MSPKEGENGKRGYTTISLSPENKDWLDSVKFAESMSYDDVISVLREALRGRRVLPGGQLVKNGA